MKNRLCLWLAQGLGIGRIPWGPGTWGSALGLLWLGLLLWPQNVWFFFGGILASIPVACFCCGIAEKILIVKDPGSVVLDEIIAIPVCYSSWFLANLLNHQPLPQLSTLFSRENVLLTTSIWIAFRILDIAKPWPIRQSQVFRGGWGIVVDDLVAAVILSAFLGAIEICRHLLK